MVNIKQVDLLAKRVMDSDPLLYKVLSGQSIMNTSVQFSNLPPLSQAEGELS